MIPIGDAVVEVKNLKTYFFLHEGTVKAVDDVSFTLRQGHSLGVIGESGCGKSVAALSIMRLIPSPPGREVGGKILFHLPAEGEGMRETVNVLDLPRNGVKMRSIRGQEIGMIFQEPMTSFSPLYTIGNQIAENLLIHKKGISKRAAHKETIEMLGRVGIPRPDRLVDNYPHQLSGGMRQRAMIAMALICGPRLLIADEPTTALDVTIEAQILDLIKDLQVETGMAMMFISHDLAVVGEVVDEIMVMYLGLVMEHGSTNQIFENPLHPYTIALWRSIPTIEGALQRLVPISGSLPSPYALIPGCPFFDRCESRKPGLCDAVLPALKQVAPDHYVRCVMFES